MDDSRIRKFRQDLVTSGLKPEINGGRGRGTGSRGVGRGGGGCFGCQSTPLKNFDLVSQLVRERERP